MGKIIFIQLEFLELNSPITYYLMNIMKLRESLEGDPISSPITEDLRNRIVITLKETLRQATFVGQHLSHSSTEKKREHPHGLHCWSYKFQGNAMLYVGSMAQRRDIYRCVRDCAAPNTAPPPTPQPCRRAMEQPYSEREWLPTTLGFFPIELHSYRYFLPGKHKYITKLKL